ncbi:hypothetical protein TrCOL_g6424 [Triparma columacea]|uniref:Glycosyltransferase family 49 protein n=1 Tax=Triparma columacea TaxID=722753 RepID=A0A9W7GL38_9STRA|nr:hypothetical protein TrCOL_g6424 [Triparma columacea]
MPRLPSKLLCLLFTMAIYAVGFFSAVHMMQSNNDETDLRSRAPVTSTTTRRSSSIDTPSLSPPIPPSVPPDSESSFIAALPYPSPSCSPIENASDVEVTLVSIASMDRISSLSTFCSTWSGPMSLAFYTSLPPPEVLLQIKELAPGCGDADDRIEVTTRAQTREEEDDNSLFPVNELRNLAVEAVKTSHYVYIDFDFHPSSKILETILSPSVSAVLASSYKSALVIPAFERSYLRCSKTIEGLRGWRKKAFKECVSKLEMPTDMESLKDQIKRRMTRIFDSRWTSAPHSSTGYNAWYKQDNGSLRKIECIDSDRYEPYLVVRKCSLLPPYQSSFTGYGKNKASHSLHLRYLSYDLYALGGAFVVHVPHPASGAREGWKERGEGGAHKDKMNRLFHGFKDWLDDKYPNPDKLCNGLRHNDDDMHN